MRTSYLSCTFFALLFLGVYATADGQYAWNVSFDQKDDTTANYSPQLLACDGNHCTAIVLAGRSTASWFEFLRSDDGGLSWREQWRVQGYGAPGFVVAMQQIDSLNVVAVGDSGRIFRTFDAGVTWERQSSAPYPIASIWGVDFCDSLNGIIGLPDQSMTTSDGGRHWILGPVTSLGTENCHCYAPGKFSVLNETTGVIYRTSDNWATIDSTSPIRDTILHYPDLRRADWGTGDTIVAYGFVLGGFGLIERTTNGGMSWAKPVLPEGDAVISMTPLMDDTLLAGRGDAAFNKLLFSSDRGFSWDSDSVNVSSGGAFFKFDDVNAVARPSPGVVLAAVQAFQTLYAPGLIIRGTVSSAGVFPATYTIGIARVYPNPASTTASINFDYRAGPVRVLDVLGREVLSAPMPASGPLLLPVSSLPAGIYYVIDDR
ncbi:MAG TPA: hypothetical protein VFD13_04515, partial [Candidatus Kapabacteria bacterium]|nr:hypothetical protein [Candidatus Kapabacteria bacterium]